MLQLVKNRQSYEAKVSVNQYLTFTLGNEIYAVDILHVQEIKGAKTAIELTRVLDVPDHIKGILRVNNQIVPVVDLREFYHLNTDKSAATQVLIVLNVANKLLGVVIDNVLDIVEINQENVKASPDFFSIIEHDYIEGVGEIGERLVMILNIEKLFHNKNFKVSYGGFYSDDKQRKVD